MLVLLLVSALWGAHAVIGQAVETSLSPVAVTLWRFTCGTICYLPWFGRLRHVIKLPHQRLWQILVAGLCSSVFYPLFYYQCLHDLTPVEALLLVNTSPFMAALFGRLFFKERLSSMVWTGILIAFAGVVTMVLGQLSGHFSIVGMIMALLSAASFAGYTVSSRSLFQALPLFDVLVATSLIGTVVLWLISPFFTPLPVLMHALLSLPFSAWMEFLYIVVIVSVVSYMFYGYGLKRVPAGIASALTFYPQVIFGALVQWAWLGIVPGWMIVISACLILGGTAIMRYGEKKAHISSTQPMEL